MRRKKHAWFAKLQLASSLPPSRRRCWLQQSNRTELWARDFQSMGFVALLRIEVSHRVLTRRSVAVGVAIAWSCISSGLRCYSFLHLSKGCSRRFSTKVQQPSTNSQRQRSVLRAGCVKWFSRFYWHDQISTSSARQSPTERRRRRWRDATHGTEATVWYASRTDLGLPTNCRSIGDVRKMSNKNENNYLSWSKSRAPMAMIVLFMLMLPA